MADGGFVINGLYDVPIKCHYDQILDMQFFAFSYTIGLS